MAQADINVQCAHIQKVMMLPVHPGAANPSFAPAIQALQKLVEMNTEILPVLPAGHVRTRFTLAVRMRGQ